MLSCREVSQRASDLVDGDLGRLDSLQMRMHLLFCKGCAQFVKQVRVARDLSMVLPDPAPVTVSDQAKIDALFAAAGGKKPQD